MAKKYEVYFVVTDADGNARPVVMRTWANSPIEAINQAKKRDKRYCLQTLYSER